MAKDMGSNHNFDNLNGRIVITQNPGTEMRFSINIWDKSFLHAKKWVHCHSLGEREREKFRKFG